MGVEQEYPDVVVFCSGTRKSRARYHIGETLLDTARRANIVIATSCENGDCGTCMVELIEGEVFMRQNNVLTPQDVDAGCVLACQAMPISKSCVVEIY